MKVLNKENSLEIFENKKIIIQNLKIKNIFEFEKFIENKNIIHIIYNKKKFSFLKIFNLEKSRNFFQNLKNSEENTIFFLSGFLKINFDFSINFSFNLKKNQTLISNSKLFNNKIILQIAIQNPGYDIEIINLEISEIFSQINIHFENIKKYSPNFFDSLIKLNDYSEINGLKFLLFFKEESYSKSLLKAEYRNNIFLKNLEFKIFNLKKFENNFSIIEFYYCKNFSFINNYLSNKDIFLLKIFGEISEKEILQSKFPNFTKIFILNPDYFFIKNIQLIYLNEIINNICLLNQDSIKKIDEYFLSEEKILFLIDFEKEIDFDFSKLKISKSKIFFFGIQRFFQTFFSLNNYKKIYLKIQNNLEKNSIKLKNYIDFEKYFEYMLGNQNILFFDKMFLKFSNKKFFEKIHIKDSDIIINFLNDERNNNLNIFEFNENFYNLINNNFKIIKKPFKNQKINIFKVDHSFNFHEFKNNFLAKNKFQFNEKFFNLIDKNFLISKIFLLEEYIVKKDDIEVLILKRNYASNYIKKIIETDNLIRKYFLIIPEFGKNIQLRIFLINKIDNKISEVPYNQIEELKNNFYFKIENLFKFSIINLIE